MYCVAGRCPRFTHWRQPPLLLCRLFWWVYMYTDNYAMFGALHLIIMLQLALVTSSQIPACVCAFLLSGHCRYWCTICSVFLLLRRISLGWDMGDICFLFNFIYMCMNVCFIMYICIWSIHIDPYRVGVAMRDNRLRSEFVLFHAAKSPSPETAALRSETRVKSPSVDPARFGLSSLCDNDYLWRFQM